MGNRCALVHLQFDFPGPGNLSTGSEEKDIYLHDDNPEIPLSDTATGALVQYSLWEGAAQDARKHFNPLLHNKLPLTMTSYNPIGIRRARHRTVGCGTAELVRPKKKAAELREFGGPQSAS